MAGMDFTHKETEELMGISIGDGITSVNFLDARPTAWSTGDLVTWENMGRQLTGTVIGRTQFANGCQLVSIRINDGHASVAGVYGWLLREDR
jgi:hypothetical protein